MKIELNETQLTAIYRNGNQEVKSAIKEALGSRLSDVVPIMERVKTLEDAIDELGDSHPAVMAYRASKYSYADELSGGDILAYLALRIITLALNEEWIPTFAEDERRWYVWYSIVCQEEYDSMTDEEKSELLLWGGPATVGSSAGLGLAASATAWSLSTSGCGSRLAFKTKELAEYAAKQFVEFYADFCFIPKEKEESAD